MRNPFPDCCWVEYGLDAVWLLSSLFPHLVWSLDLFAEGDNRELKGILLLKKDFLKMGVVVYTFNSSTSRGRDRWISVSSRLACSI